MPIRNRMSHNWKHHVGKGPSGRVKVISKKQVILDKMSRLETKIQDQCAKGVDLYKVQRWSKEYLDLKEDLRLLEVQQGWKCND